MSRLIFVVFISIIIAKTAVAQDMTYQPQDAALLNKCIASVNSSFDSSDDTASARNLTDCIGIAFSACQDESPLNSTTIGMRECATREISWWDKMLNNNYSDLKNQLGEDEFTELKKAQLAWVSYRDQKCEFEYFYWRDGTIRSIFYSSCQLDMTARRAIDLAGYLEWVNM